MLPPGQKALAGAPPRFGLDEFMRRTAVTPAEYRLRIQGEVEQAVELSVDEIFSVRDEFATELHCVTTWSALGLTWSGRPFRSFWQEVVVPRARPLAGVAHLRVVALDGFAASLPLEEALDARAFLADGLNGGPLGEHGAPLRLVLPQLYGYKSVKHLSAIEFSVAPRPSSGGRFLAHPRGRVDLEERSGVGLQRFWRWLYKLLLPVFLWRARSLSAKRLRAG